jgi:hypothetical protein
MVASLYEQVELGARVRSIRQMPTSTAEALTMFGLAGSRDTLSTPHDLLSRPWAWPPALIALLGPTGALALRGRDLPAFLASCAFLAGTLS